jgi:plasmid stabilization system protein ParE
MPARVLILRKAYADLDSHFEFITRNVSRSSAIRWRDRLLERIATLEHHPEQHPLSEDAGELGLELREFLVGRRRHVYRVLFTIEGDVVNVHRVRHAAQTQLDPDDL